MNEYQINFVGNLKYERLKTLSLLRKELNSLGYNFNITETKRLLDSIISNTFKERFNYKFKVCFDKIFDNIEYTEFNYYPIEQNFPDNFIPPIG